LLIPSTFSQVCTSFPMKSGCSATLRMVEGDTFPNRSSFPGRRPGKADSRDTARCICLQLHLQDTKAEQDRRVALGCICSRGIVWILRHRE
ncbi:hypothetical protein PMAYCL1PPCAC_26521, partial [Pristionchus mayeri]